MKEEKKNIFVLLSVASFDRKSGNKSHYIKYPTAGQLDIKTIVVFSEPIVF